MYMYTFNFYMCRRRVVSVRITSCYWNALSTAVSTLPVSLITTS